MEELEVGSVIGPVLVGLEKPVQIASMNASVSDIINLAAVASVEAIDEKNQKVIKKPKKGAVVSIDKAKKN